MIMSKPQLTRGVVVGYDGTDASAAALAWAARQAALQRTVLRIVHVAPPRADPPPGLHPRAAADLAAVRPRPHLVAWRVDRGDPVARLARAAAGARLLVLGHRDPRPLIGSTLAGVLGHQVSDVAVVPGSWSAREPLRNRIVVGVRDGASRHALDLACTLATAAGAALTVVHSTDALATSGDRRTAEQTIRLEAAARGMLESLLDSTLRTGCDLDLDVRLVPGDPTGALLRAGRTADLIVVGARLLDGLPGRRLGSTIERLLGSSDRPVLVARPVRAGLRGLLARSNPFLRVDRDAVPAS